MISTLTNQLMNQRHLSCFSTSDEFIGLGEAGALAAVLLKILTSKGKSLQKRQLFLY